MGTALVIGGVVAILIGGKLAESVIESTFGSVDRETVAASEGTGVIPSWVSLVVLLGYLTAFAGMIALIVAFVA